MSKLFCVQWAGSFGFIKPFMAVRDDMVYSQQFLTESIISGIEMMLFPELIENKQGYVLRKIVRHRLKYQEMVLQQETIQSVGVVKGNRSKSIVERGVLINPIVTFAFENEESARRALKQHIFLCRNEDILFPIGDVIVIEAEEFETDKRFYGFELIHGLSEESVLVGFNRYREGQPMYGKLVLVGDGE